jgi:hypothetical protein
VEKSNAKLKGASKKFKRTAFVIASEAPREPRLDKATWPSRGSNLKFSEGKRKIASSLLLLAMTQEFQVINSFTLDKCS